MKLNLRNIFYLIEMAVEEPVSGSFSYYADKYWGLPGIHAGLELLVLLRHHQHG